MFVLVLFKVSAADLDLGPGTMAFHPSLRSKAGLGGLGEGINKSSTTNKEPHKHAKDCPSRSD